MASPAQESDIARRLAPVRITVERTAPLSETAWTDFVRLFSIRELKQGETLLQAGQRADKLAWVESGALREMLLTREGNEYNKAFILPGQFTGSLFDLLTGEPSTASIQALKPTQLLVANYHDFTALYDRYPVWERMARRLAEDLFMKKALREFELLTMDATQRYQSLLKRTPELERHVPQYHVASYLGITPVALSRIKRSLAANPNTPACG